MAFHRTFHGLPADPPSLACLSRRAGTFVGCLPAVTAYVTAGEVGADVAINGAESDPLLLALGAAATIGAITFAGNIATSALKDLDLDLEA